MQLRHPHSAVLDLQEYARAVFLQQVNDQWILIRLFSPHQYHQLFLAAPDILHGFRIFAISPDVSCIPSPSRVQVLVFNTAHPHPRHPIFRQLKMTSTISLRGADCCASPLTGSEDLLNSESTYIRSKEASTTDLFVRIHLNTLQKVIAKVPPSCILRFLFFS